MYFLITIFVLIMLLSMAFFLGSTPGIFMLVFGFLVVFTMITMTVAKRQNRSQSTFWLIATSVRNQLPLPDLIDAQANEFRGKRGQRLLEFSDQLREGIPLPIAIDYFYRLIPNQGHLAMRVGGETGTLQEQMASVTRHLDRTRNPERYNYYYLIFYLILVASLLFLITTFLMYRIVPRYKDIFEGFGLDLPLVTLQLISASDFFVIYYYLVPLVTILLAGIVLAAIFTRYRGMPLRGVERDRRFPTFQMMSRMILKPFGLMVDQFTRLYPSRHSAEILRYLGVSAEAGKPLLATVESLSRHFPYPDLRKRLQKVLARAEGGTELWEAMAGQKLISRHHAALLRAAEQSRSLGYALREMSDSFETRKLHRTSKYWEWGRCAVVFLYSAVVAFIAIAMFYPIISVIRDLS